MAEETVPNIVKKIQHIVKNHRVLPQEQAANVFAWLERLLKKSESEYERSNLLKYAKYLEYQLKAKSLIHPFNKPPPTDLVPLSVVINEQLGMVNEIIEAHTSTTNIEPCSKQKSKSKDRNTLCDWDLHKWMKNLNESKSQEECNENNNACNEIMKEASKPNVKLADFLMSIIPHTDDNGDLIRQVAINELRAFRELVFRIFTDRIQQVDKILSSRQCLMKQNYLMMEQQLLNRAKIAQDYLKQLLPGFNYNDYLNDENYIRNILIEIDSKQTDECEPNKIDPADAVREKQFKLKFLKDEVRHREEKNEELMDEYNNLMMQLNEVIKEQQEKFKQNMKRNKDLKDKLAGLKITADENQIIFDKLNLDTRM